MSNMRYLSVAWQLYAEDNHGRLIENYHGAKAQGGAIAGMNPYAAPWACGWEDWTVSPDNTNTLFIRNIRYAKLSPYLNVERNVHKCPSDQYVSSFQNGRGWNQRIRSISMNGTVGGYVSDGPFPAIYKEARRLSDLINPRPSETFVFLDEHPASINDPVFFPPTSAGWVDFPGNLHNGAATMSFADGHIEMHRWHGQMRTSPVKLCCLPGTQSDADTHWVSYHSQRTGETSY